MPRLTATSKSGDDVVHRRLEARRRPTTPARHLGHLLGFGDAASDHQGAYAFTVRGLDGANGEGAGTLDALATDHLRVLVDDGLRATSVNRFRLPSTGLGRHPATKAVLSQIGGEGEANGKVEAN